MNRPEATKISKRVRELLSDMLNSGDSSRVYVASAIDEVASNADIDPTSRADDAFLRGFARDLMQAADHFRRSLPRLHPGKEPVDEQENC